MKPDEIKRMRIHLELSREKFAHLIGVSLITVNRWEGGKTNPRGHTKAVLVLLGACLMCVSPQKVLDVLQTDFELERQALHAVRELVKLEQAIKNALFNRTEDRL
jgi:DNA-binding XRE family transcriptional regulator